MSEMWFFAVVEDEVTILAPVLGMGTLCRTRTRLCRDIFLSPSPQGPRHFLCDGGGESWGEGRAGHCRGA